MAGKGMTMAKERTAISVKMRFEVFKRDKFTCTYCGATAAQKLLHCDHVKPVAEGGKTTLLNLTTACVDCNLGKGARLLSDDSALTIQHQQLADLEERRQQLEMMRRWREELEAHKVSEVDIAIDAVNARGHLEPDRADRNDLRRLIKKYGLVEVLAGVNEAFDVYYRDATDADWNTAFHKIGGVLRIRAQSAENPDIRKLFYIQGILRNRYGGPSYSCIEDLKKIRGEPIDLDLMEEAAKKADSWEHYRTSLSKLATRRTVRRMEDEGEERRAGWLDEMRLPQPIDDMLRDISRLADCMDGFSNLHVGPEWAAMIRGLQCVGLVEGDAGLIAGDALGFDEEGRLETTAALRTWWPGGRSRYYNDHGGIRLRAFYPDTTPFASVRTIYA